MQLKVYVCADGRMRQYAEGEQPSGAVLVEATKPAKSSEKETPKKQGKKVVD